MVFINQKINHQMMVAGKITILNNLISNCCWRKEVLRSGFLRLVVLCILIFPILTPQSFASESQQELLSFKSAVALFNDGFWDAANKALNEFIEKFPNSPYVPEAAFIQAQARIRIKDYNGAIEILKTHYSKAGQRADEYLYLIGESYYYLGNYNSAADLFMKLINEFPKSKKVIDATYRQALCAFQTNNYQVVIQILGSTNSLFQQTPVDKSNAERIAQGKLLLAEALIRSGQYSSAENVIRSINLENLPVDLQWQWHFLLCRTYSYSKRYADAILLSTNLLSLAQKTDENILISQSAKLMAEVYENSGDVAKTIELLDRYMQIFDAETRRFALLKIANLSADLGNISESAARLENYISIYTNEPTMDVVLLTAGELRLKEYWLSAQKWKTNDTLVNLPGESNLLKQAQMHFNKIIADFPKSHVLPKANLQRGWCSWLSGDIAQSKQFFQFAAENIPPSMDNALARFKLGDVELFMGNYSNAIYNYNILITNYFTNQIVKESLIVQALYQKLRAAINLADIRSAEEAISMILQFFPDTEFSQKGILLMGQAYNRVDNPSKAREIMELFLKKFPNSPLLQEVELAVAKSFVKEGNFQSAASHYDSWYNKYGTNLVKPQAEFDRGFAHYQAGNDTNALHIFQMFIQKYPTNQLAAIARYWIGQFYYRFQDYTNAETQFQLIFQDTNFLNSPISFQARMMAGRSAFARQGFKDAADYFRSVINNEKCPPEIAVEAWFALGDTLIEQGSVDPVKKLDQFKEAVVVFNRITQIYPTNRLATIALGRLGDCYLHLAQENPENYMKAIEYYQKVIASNADVSTRSQAETSLGIVYERLAQLKLPNEKGQFIKQALEHYLNVVYGRNLKVDHHEQPDIFWIKKAGLNAISLLESIQQWEQLINLCNRLKPLMPSMSDYFSKKIIMANEKIASGKPL